MQDRSSAVDVTPASLHFDGDAEALSARLRRRIGGEVRFDRGSRALYATDGSNYRHTPIGVVIPRDIDDVQETVALCREFGAPILSRGGGTSLAGQCCNVAVILDFSKYMHGILELDPKKRIARVQPGIVCDDLRNAAEKHHLTFGPDPATHAWCTIGGMIGNNSCGVHSQMAGRTSDNVEALDILTYDGTRMHVGATPQTVLEHLIRGGGRRGEIYRDLLELRNDYASLIRSRFPRIPRRISGYNLDALLPEEGFHVGRALVGSESTCVVVLEATVKLVYSPPGRSLLVLGYPDIFQAADHLPEVLEFKPVGLEALDRRFVADLQKKHLQLNHLALFPPGGGFLLVEFGGETRAASHAAARRLMTALSRHRNAPSMKLFDDPSEEKQVWHVRESGLGATAHVPGEQENWEGWEDSAVAPEKLGGYLRELQKLFDRFGYVGCLYGHFGNGCLHTRINFDLKTAEGVRKFRQFISEASDLVVKYGGSLSGEHGDGQSRAEMLPKMFGPELIEAFNRFKAIWDPDWKMNPGKIVHPRRIDQDLRYGPGYRPHDPVTHFKYPTDGFSFARAMERCVGVGKCRRENAGTMCPSYMVTREEKHSTRGRARLLFEMLRGEVLEDQWRSEAVKDALDLCLACKGCKSDCPVHVDMATYKAEFLSHYYHHRLRPRHAYAFGLIHKWAGLASYFPRLVNFIGRTIPFSTLFKGIAGIARERQVPQFAREPFSKWFAQRERHRAHAELSGGERSSPRENRVLLWVDTFNNYFHPHIARAATEVLDDAGFTVEIPRQNLCCGRPLYDFGMLQIAGKWLGEILNALREPITAGIPMVVLEPSCCAVFRDELVNLLPNNPDAQRLRKQTFTLGEFIARFTPDYPRKELHRKAIVHAHCHQKGVLGMTAEEQVLKRLGLEYELLDAGCCGMAGAFGFEKAHYEISVKCGERVLLPRVRETPQQDLVIVDGFSCHEQIRQLTGREALHLAQVLHLAMTEGSPRRPALPAAQPVPEEQHEHEEQPTHTRGAIAGVVAAAAAGIGTWYWSRHHRSSVAQASQPAVSPTSQSAEQEPH